eukprot:gene1047-1024_t
MNNNPAQTGVILFAHGSRDPLWRLPIDAVADNMKARWPELAVACAFLELTAPDLNTTVEQLMSQGLSHIRIVPMFLGVGRHAREDLPALVQDLQQAYPQMHFELMPAIGEHPAMTALMADIAAEAARRNLNLTETAKALHTSQPGVSKAIIELEEELGIEIFARHGKRLKRITEPGQHVLHSIEAILREVYEHMVYAPNQHWSAAHFDGLAARAFIVSSFGKTYHVTGWKIGTVAAPAAFTAEFRKVHQFNVFTVNTPMQHALARFMADTAPYLELPAFYQRKRDLFRQGLAQTKFKLLPGEGTYFQCVDISGLDVPEKNLSEAQFCQWLTSDIGVAAIPLSAFYGNGFDQKVIR